MNPHQDPVNDPDFKKSYFKWKSEYNWYVYLGAAVLLTGLGIYVFWDHIPNPFIAFPCLRQGRS